MAGKVCNPEESGLLGFMKRWTFPKEIRKKDKHADMMLRYIRNELQLLHLAAACSKIARTSVKVGRTILLPLLLLDCTGASFRLITYSLRVFLNLSKLVIVVQFLHYCC